MGSTVLAQEGRLTLPGTGGLRSGSWPSGDLARRLEPAGCEKEPSRRWPEILLIGPVHFWWTGGRQSGHGGLARLGKIALAGHRSGAVPGVWRWAVPA